MQNLEVPDIQDFYQVAQLYIGPKKEPWIIGRAGDWKLSKFLEEILQAKGIPITWEDQNFLEDRGQVPSLQGSNNEYTVKGIGKCMKLKGTYLFLDADSFTCNTKIDEEHLKEFQKLNRDFEYAVCRGEPPKPQPPRNFKLMHGNKL